RINGAVPAAATVLPSGEKENECDHEAVEPADNWRSSFPVATLQRWIEASELPVVSNVVPSLVKAISLILDVFPSLFGRFAIPGRAPTRRTFFAPARSQR